MHTERELYEILKQFFKNREFNCTNNSPTKHNLNQQDPLSAKQTQLLSFGVDENQSPKTSKTNEAILERRIRQVANNLTNTQDSQSRDADMSIESGGAYQSIKNRVLVQQAKKDIASLNSKAEHFKRRLEHARKSLPSSAQSQKGVVRN